MAVRGGTLSRWCIVWLKLTRGGDVGARTLKGLFKVSVGVRRVRRPV